MSATAATAPDCVTSLLTCQVCGSTRHRVKFAKRGHASILCLGDTCGMQSFVKSPTGALLLRAKLGLPLPGWKRENEEHENNGIPGRRTARQPARASVVPLASVATQGR